MKKYYFAYGSNLDSVRMRARVGNVVNLGRHVLHGWRLVFNAGVDKQCFANIIFTGELHDVVEGVVYQLTARQLKKLDYYEGTPRFYTRMIDNYKGKDLQVYVSINPYYTQQQNRKVLPTREYIGYILRGASENGLITTQKIAQDYYSEIILNK